MSTKNGRKVRLSPDEWRKLRRDQELDAQTDAWLEKHDERGSTGKRRQIKK